MTQYRDMTLDQVRSKLSGFHFAKECLSDGEREILTLAERLLSELDELDPRGYKKCFEWENNYA